MSVRRRTLDGGTGDMIKGEVYSSAALACDVVFVYNNDGSLHIIREESDWPSSSDYTPVGIVVIPGSHGVVGQDACGVISLVDMRTDTPETGGDGSENAPCFGYTGFVEELLSYNKYTITADNTSNVASGLCEYGTQGYSNAYIPAQQEVGGTPTRSSSPYSPSPYVGSDYKSGAYNTSYGTTQFDTVSDHNGFTDFKGVINTKILTDRVTGENWRTVSSLSNSINGYHPAACSCARFHTLGTKAFKDCTVAELNDGVDFWYLPSVGELGYIPPKAYDLNDTISKLNTAYGVGLEIYSTHHFSSTRFYCVDSYGVLRSCFSVVTRGGRAYMLTNDLGVIYSARTRAFMRLKKTADKREEAPIYWSDLYYSYLIDESNSVSLVNPNNLSVTYSSSDTSVATIDSSGNVTFVGEGICTLSAYFAGNSSYQAKTVICTLTIKDYSNDYLTFEALESGTFTLNLPAGITTTHVPSVSYSTNGGYSWTTVANSNTSVDVTTPTIAAGGKVLWKAEAIRFATSTSNYCNFTSTGNFKVYGNIMSLEYGDNFASQTSLKNYTYSFFRLFGGNTKVVSAENLVLPATTLRANCYRAMFYKCSGLTTAPKMLPATSATTYCYYSMFSGCTSLTKTPELPATTLASYCYTNMFRDCTSLITAPELSATKLSTYCYQYMFRNSTSLKFIKCLATDISATGCTENWVTNVGASGTFTKAASTAWITGNSGIPYGWTVVDAT